MISRLLKITLLVLISYYTIPHGNNSYTYAQSLEGIQVKDSGTQHISPVANKDLLFHENVANFRKWKKNIPDYEKRLYDRVKAVNKRVIRVQNLIIASFFLFLIFYIFYFHIINKQLSRNFLLHQNLKRTPVSNEIGSRIEHGQSDKASARIYRAPHISLLTFRKEFFKSLSCRQRPLDLEIAW